MTATKTDLTQLTPNELEFYRATQKYLDILDDKQSEDWSKESAVGYAGETILTNPISRIDSSIHVGSFNGFPSTPFKIKIGDDGEEHMYVTKAGGNIWEVTRGIDNTTAREHWAGTKINVIQRVGR